MKLVEVVILVGSQCISPLQAGDRLTDAGKVSCAVLIRQDPQTADIEIVPRAAATDPDVVALLARPRREAATIVPASAEDVTGSITLPRPVPDTASPGRVIEASAETVSEVVLPKLRPAMSTKQTKSEPSTRARQASTRKRTDSCGSYRAVWYTNKEGRRRYRCVKSG